MNHLISRQSRPHKRKRTVISCTECHRRKQKCDRQYPCFNCVRRGKEGVCHYDAESNDCEPTPSNLSENASSEFGTSNSTANMCPAAISDSEWVSEFQDQIRNFGYSNHGNHNSLGLLRTTQLHKDQDATLATSSATNLPPLRSDADYRYKELIRLLPSPICVNILVQTFFSYINWQYDLLDEDSFRQQLKIWGSISYSDIQSGIGTLAPEILVIPALLLQVLAQALLFHPPYDERINCLITMAGMTFQDLSVEYSNASAEILDILGKRGVTITTVQTGVLRASSLKSSGKVIEAWHTLGAAIRDAQELGLHTGQGVPGQTPITIGHRVWVVLHIWDIHMAVVLGRPIATDFQLDCYARTIKDDESRNLLFSHWKTETELPRPFDVILAGYNVAYQYFQDIHLLEKKGATPQDYSTVKRIHATVKKNLESLPSWCRLEKPDTKFDQARECQWLPFAREGLSSLIHLVLLTLHRPYIFSVANSRIEALKAGISILHVQERLFEKSESHQCKVFNPVYASFDAIVLISAICICFPDQNDELQTEGVQVVKRGIQRLGFIGQFNEMAKSAHSITCSLYHRLKLRLGIFEPIEAGASLNEPGWTFSYNNHANTVPPPRPTHDLFYDHISSIQTHFDTLQSLPSNPYDANNIGYWNFEGVFPDASFWNLMNGPSH